MRKLAVAFLILVAAASYADKTKTKSKEKRFDPVVRELAAYAGNYRGPSEAYAMVLEVSPNGTLRGNYVELGRVAVLNAIEVDGANFKARASFDDGSVRTITGSFANRVLNGETAFGARVENVPVQDMGLIDTFFERMD
jgi:hypothetical protein